MTKERLNEAIEEFKRTSIRYKDVFKWSDKYTTLELCEIYKEIMNRWDELGDSKLIEEDFHPKDIHLESYQHARPLGK